MSTFIRTTAFAATLTLIAGTVQAQSAGPFSLEVRAGAALPTQALGASDLETGLTLEVTANLQVMPHLNLYLGGDWTHFTFEQQVSGFTDVEDTGWAFGARFFAPSMGPATPWIRAGGIYDHIELEGDNADESVGSDHVLGWEVGAGAAFALGGRWSLLPGVRYRAFSPELTELGGEVDVSYVTFDLGLSFTFGGPSMAALGHR